MGTGQESGRDSQQLPSRMVTTCKFIPCRQCLEVVGQAVADPVALREGAVQQYVVGTGFVPSAPTSGLVECV